MKKHCVCIAGISTAEALAVLHNAALVYETSLQRKIDVVEARYCLKVTRGKIPGALNGRMLFLDFRNDQVIDVEMYNRYNGTGHAQVALGIYAQLIPNMVQHEAIIKLSRIPLDVDLVQPLTLHHYLVQPIAVR